MQLTDEQIANLEPLAQFRKRVNVSRETLLVWRKKGRWNPTKTKLVKLKMAWLPIGGWGCCMEFYNDFIRELQEVE